MFNTKVKPNNTEFGSFVGSRSVLLEKINQNDSRIAALRKNVFIQYAEKWFAELLSKINLIALQLNVPLYQKLPEPNWLVLGDRSYWLHTRLDPCGALNLMCSRPRNGPAHFEQYLLVLPILYLSMHWCICRVVWMWNNLFEQNIT